MCLNSSVTYVVDPFNALTFGPRLGSGSFAAGFIRGGSAYGLLRCTSSRCVWLRQTVAALPPRINPSTQPSDVARGSRSRAAAELTLILCRSCRRLRSFDLDLQHTKRSQPRCTRQLLQVSGCWCRGSLLPVRPACVRPPPAPTHPQRTPDCDSARPCSCPDPVV